MLSFCQGYCNTKNSNKYKRRAKTIKVDFPFLPLVIVIGAFWFIFPGEGKIGASKSFLERFIFLQERHREDPKCNGKFPLKKLTEMWLH